MNGIMGMTELALMRATDAKQVGQLNKCKAASMHLLAVINDILDISKIEADRLPLEQQRFRLDDVMNQALGIQEPVARLKGLELEHEIGPDIPQELRGDAFRLRQILLNYIGNAIKFSRQGRITVRANLVEAATDSVLLRLEVADQGIGISPEKQATLFRAFSQADDSTTRQYGGTGLGLVIVRRLAELMGGETGVESAEAAGSTFWATVRLQRVDASGEAPTPPSDGSPRDIIASLYKGQRVLVADDDPMTQEVEALLLQDAGLIADLASNGREAVEKAGTGGHAMILMDVEMPVMNGLDAARAIRNLPGLRHIPILALTGDTQEAGAQCTAAGMDERAVKPMQPADFYASVLRMLQRPIRAESSPMAVPA